MAIVDAVQWLTQDSRLRVSRDVEFEFESDRTLKGFSEHDDDSTDPDSTVDGSNGSCGITGDIRSLEGASDGSSCRSKR